MQRPHMVQTVVGGKQEEIKRSMQNLAAYLHVLFGTIFPYLCTVTLVSFCFSFQEQYDFCYRVVQDFVDIFSDYANFK